MTRIHWAIAALGAWAMGSAVVSFVASQDFFTIDRLLAASSNERFAALVAQLGAPDARELLRYLASELNRLFFSTWNEVQLALGLAVIVLARPMPGPAARPSRLPWWIVIGMFVVVVVMYLYLEPQITSMGRALDFVPRDPAPPLLARFGVFHAAYAALEVAKLAAALVVVWLLSRTNES